jgi:hypothetical protein
MPLFRRSDGDLVRDEAPSRVILPYLMRGRNESIILHESVCDITRTRVWLRAFNGAGPEQTATLFHLFLWACGRTAHLRPKMNRFVAGGRLYQRRGVWLSFAAKRELRLDAPLVPVKLDFPDVNESFAGFVRRLTRYIEDARSSEDRLVDREVALSMRFPHIVRRMLAGVYRAADRMNLLPQRLVESDPLFASVFIANLGSLGLDRTWHHLYEYGTCSLFAVLGKQREDLVADGRGQPVTRDALTIRWSFDERITDAYYCASSLDMVRRTVENPARHAGEPEPAARGDAVPIDERSLASSRISVQ